MPGIMLKNKTKEIGSRLIRTLQHFSVEKAGIESLVSWLTVSQVARGEGRMHMLAFWQESLEY